MVIYHLTDIPNLWVLFKKPIITGHLKDSTSVNTATDSSCSLVLEEFCKFLTRWIAGTEHLFQPLCTKPSTRLLARDTLILLLWLAKTLCVKMCVYVNYGKKTIHTLQYFSPVFQRGHLLAMIYNIIYHRRCQLFTLLAELLSSRAFSLCKKALVSAGCP